MLSHIKVLDFSTTLPGPYCTMLLSYFGADVIKVERPGSGDTMREMDPWIYENINFNKRSIVLDLKSESDRNIVYELVKHMDIVIEGFRPSVAERLGIDFETLKKLNPQIIYCSISGFGQTGPYRDIPGHDLNYMGLSGALSMTGRIEEDPDGGHVQKIPVSDFGTGTLAATAILACLNHPERKATYIDLSMTDLLFTWTGLKAGHFYHMARPVDSNEQAEAHYGVFKTKDHKYVALGVIEDHFWHKMCEYFEWNDFLEDTEYSTYLQRLEKRKEILPRLRQAIANRGQISLVNDLLSLGVPCTSVKNLEELVDDPHVQERNLLLRRNTRFEESVSKESYDISVPIRISGYESSPRRKAPEIGEHQEDILRQFQITRETK